MIAVVDYGVNNVASVVRALQAAGHPGTLTADPAVILAADRVLLPGVGNFGQGMKNLQRGGIASAIREVASAGRPILGICLGLQLLFKASEEAPEVEGLDLLPGRVQRFQTTLPVPHVGWARIAATAAGRTHPLTSRLLAEPEFYYHVHSYHPADVPSYASLATGEYAGAFSAIVAAGNVAGAQFHPEKSQRAGIALLAAFAEWRP